MSRRCETAACIAARIARLEKRYFSKRDKLFKILPCVSDYDWNMAKNLEYDMDAAYNELDVLLKTLGSSAFEYIVMKNKKLDYGKYI